MIKHIIFASAALSAALGAALAATGPALAQTGPAATPAVQLTGAMRSVSLSEAMTDAEARIASRPVHGVMARPLEMADERTLTVPSPRLAMLDRFAAAEQRLGDIMIAPGVDIVRPRRMLSLAGSVSDDHDFGNIGFSEVDAFHTDPSPSQIGLRFSF